MNAPLLETRGLTRRYGERVAVAGLDLAIARGEFFCLLGASGCGKSTLLRLLAGFEAADSGRILFEDRDITADPPHRRPLNMMFQSYALFPHLSVRNNIGFGLQQARLPRAEITRRVDEMLAMLQLDDCATRYPRQLSGGQRQRVALARALAGRPPLLLLDEPLGALDRKLRENTREELRRLQAELGTTFILVTHDQEEALSLATRMAVMAEGQLLQVGPPQEIYTRPNCRAVAEFLGRVNLIEATVEELAPDGVRFRADGELRLQLLSGSMLPPDSRPDSRLCLALRPEQIRLVPEAAGDRMPNHDAGIVTGNSYLGDHTLLTVRSDTGREWLVQLSHAAASSYMPRQGERTGLCWDATAPVVLAS